MSLMRPSLISLKTYSAVISLARLAGKISWSASRSNSTLPFSASIRMACGAEMLGSSFCGASFLGAGAVAAALWPGTTLCAGVAASAPAQKPASTMAAVSQRPKEELRFVVIGARSPIRLPG